MPHNFDFLSVGEEFGADARATECSERSSASTIRAVSDFRVLCESVKFDRRGRFATVV